MERLFILGILIFLIEGAGMFLSQLSLVIITLFILCGVYYIFKIKYLEIYVISILFLLRLVFSLNFDSYEVGDNVSIKSNIKNGFGYVEKINNKYPRKFQNVYVDYIEDGRSLISGKITKQKYFYLLLDEKEVEKFSENMIEEYFKNKIESMRYHMSNEGVNLINAMIIGDRGYISKDVYDKFRYTGAAHLLAISGLHIGIITGLILWGLNLLNIKKELKYIATLIILTTYILGINRSPSVMRAYIMGVTFIVSQIIFEKADIQKSFVVAFIINLFILPNGFSSVSFVMSYMCLFLILWIYPRFEIVINIKHKEIYNFLIFLLVIQMGISPLTLYYFQTINVFSYFTNLVLTPIGSLFIGFSFAGFLFPSFLMGFYGKILEGMYLMFSFLLNTFVKLPLLSIEIENKINLILLLSIYILCIGIILRKK